jgi:hypothetical protein
MTTVKAGELTTLPTTVLLNNIDVYQQFSASSVDEMIIGC